MQSYKKNKFRQTKMPYFLNMHLLTFIFNPTLNSFPDRLLLDGVPGFL